MAAFVLGIRAFKSKDAARTEVRRILHETPIEVPLRDGDATLILALYARHPRRSGVPSHIVVGINNYHGTSTRGFHAVFPDHIDRFSYIPCLNPLADQPNLIAALRAAVQPSQREALRAAYNGRVAMPCAICRALVPLEAAHVHHKHPKFRDIADAFVALLGVPAIVIGEIGDVLAEPAIQRRWVRFHDAVAQRVVVCQPCNAADERD